jgi:hypothetical protein
MVYIRSSHLILIKLPNMKNIKITLLLIAALSFSAYLSAQTADEIVQNYIKAIGGSELLNTITSVYTESVMEAMGSEAPTSTTVLNGKGYKNEIEMMGTKIIQCVTDSGAWAVNPMAGSSTPQALPEDQYKSQKDEIWVGGSLLRYTSQGGKVELLGQEMLGTVNAFKVKLTSIDNAETVYYFDPSTWYLLMAVSKGDMMGQPVDIKISFSDYKKTDFGYVMPYSMDLNFGDQFSMTAKVKKVDINIPVDPAIFDMKNN